jgi:hypothetical protein
MSACLDLLTLRMSYLERYRQGAIAWKTFVGKFPTKFCRFELTALASCYFLLICVISVQIADDRKRSRRKLNTCCDVQIEVELVLNQHAVVFVYTTDNNRLTRFQRILLL